MLRWLEPKKGHLISKWERSELKMKKKKRCAKVVGTLERAPDFKRGEIFLLLIGDKKTKIPSNIIYMMSYLPPEKTRL